MSAIIILPGRPTSDPQIMPGKEQQHDLYDSGHPLPPAGSGRKQGERILFLLFQFLSG